MTTSSTHTADSTGASGALPVTMSALRIDGYGHRPALVQIPTPSAGPGQVLVEVAAAALNPLDVNLVAGHLADFFPVESFPYTVGTDLSGTVAAVGSDVTDWKVGDQVVARTDPPAGGAVAEFAVVPVRHLASAPASVPLPVAAGIGTVAGTAWQALHEIADIRPGQTVLVHAGAGGVGHIAVQMAARAGARVVATTSPAGADVARRLGAHQVIDYTSTDFRTEISDVDVVVDTIGQDVEAASLDVLKPGGLLLALPVPPDADRATARGLRAEFVVHLSDGMRLAAVAAEFDAGLELLVDRTLSLEDAAQALDVVAAGHAKGKVLVEPGPR